MLDDKEAGSDLLSSFAEKTAPNHSCFPSLTLTQRVIGFAICFGIGTLPYLPFLSKNNRIIH